MAGEVEQMQPSRTAPVPAVALAFDYETLPAEVASAQRERAIRIFGLTHRGLELTAEIGRELLAAQSELEHGAFLPWVEGALGMSRSTAYRAMDIAQRFTPADLPVVGALPIAVVYKLAEKATPEPVRAEVLRRITSGEAVAGEAVLEEVRTAREAAKQQAAGEREAARREKLTPEERAQEDSKAGARRRRKADQERKAVDARHAMEEDRRKREAEDAAGAEILVEALGVDAAAAFAERFSRYVTSVLTATANLAGLRRAEGQPITSLPLHQIERVDRVALYRLDEADRERAKRIAQEIGFEGKAPVMTVARDAARPSRFRLVSDPFVYLALADELKRAEVEVRIVPPIAAPLDAAKPKTKG